jgi:hypothetical protein
VRTAGPANLLACMIAWGDWRQLLADSLIPADSFIRMEDVFCALDVLTMAYSYSILAVTKK